ncbi:Ethanolamine utilization protein EutL [Sinobacterium norvegicum]|uniref:Ethanolamine utilization protein EutL n=1 Tax=Sinobacterium norvegicum TaxID=1641715 RepID=A0ABN8EGF0_9GAMM|nr:ethanolamine utilization microcompartment protein EutL [Sinobacterium norvegicum]CAH0990432.1 Ethanolamine utilization protein EutL [Sinobacterium norvegicum]
MAVLSAIPATVLATRMVASVSPALSQQLGLGKNQYSIGMITSDCDDVTYVALDEATKAANVNVVYAHSFYAGADHASGPTSGEVIGIIAGPGPSDVRAGLSRAIEVIENEAAFQTANETGDMAFFAHVVSASGSYLSAQCEVAAGTALAYLIAPPLEAIFAIDAALKAADVELCDYFAPPSETNFAGAILSGSQAACKAACESFTQAVLDCASLPKEV